jgi:hypothetical protein
VGIGTTSPVSKLDVNGQVTATGGIFKANGSPSLSAATAGEAILAPEPTYGAFLYGRGATYDVTIGQRSTNVALAVPTGTNNIVLGGNLTFNTSNAGITFNNSSALTNSTLNDYEVGTWTPNDASGAGLSFTITGAFYTKIGNMVYAQFEISYPATSSTANAVIGGLPFTTSSTSGYRASNMVGFNNRIASLGMYASSTSTSFSFYNLGTGGTVQNVSLSSGLITATFIYRANF